MFHYWQMPRATLLSLPWKVETITLKHSVWRALRAQTNSRAADRVNRDEGWWVQGFPNPTTFSSLLLETWMLACMFQFQYFLPLAEEGNELFRAADTTSSVCPFLLFVLSAEWDTLKVRDEHGPLCQVTATICFQRCISSLCSLYSVLPENTGLFSSIYLQ